MIRFLPFLLIPLLVLGGLWYWRSQAGESGEAASRESEESQGLVEVPKTLPGASVEDRVKSLEEALAKLVPQVNNLKPSSSTNPSSASLDSRLSNVEAEVTALKVRISALEKATPAPAASQAKSTVYIPLGAGGSWSDIDWHSLPEYEISLDPANYPGYSGMYLEVNFRMAESAGTGSVRLYNVTDNSALSSQLDTTSTAFSLQTSSSFKLPSGAKTYRLQVKSSQGKDLFIQSARIKVNF